MHYSLQLGCGAVCICRYDLNEKLRTYTGVLEEGLVAPDMSAAAERVLHSSSVETGSIAGALSSARKLKGEKVQGLIIIISH